MGIGIGIAPILKTYRAIARAAFFQAFEK